MNPTRHPPSTTRHLVVLRTLCFVFDGDNVLVMRRSLTRRLFPGKVNGVGGHVEAGEDVAAAAAREIKEETGLEIADLWLAGLLHVDPGLGQVEALPDGFVPGVLVAVFTARAAGGEVADSEEGELTWVPLSAAADLDWVDGHPGLLLAALEARRTGMPFSLYRAA